ncbi:MAG: hypothetical protein DMG57_04080 [Acidobacteria bacterium]|nr:MAG: hypothetical protein DMG57_04080 [Acidobacteriota bacterium]
MKPRTGRTFVGRSQDTTWLAHVTFTPWGFRCFAGVNFSAMIKCPVRHTWPSSTKPLRGGISLTETHSASYLEIIGVAHDSKYSTPGEQTWPVLCHPFQGEEGLGTFLQVRMRGSAAAGVNPVRQALTALDRDMRIEVKTMRESIAFAYVPNRIASIALAATGVLGLLLAMIGVYGVMAYAVSRRTGEIGIRITLGASRYAVLAMVLRDGLTIIAIGLAAGISMALVLAPQLSGFLAAGMGATDPLIFAGVAVLLASVGLNASLVPAWRAARVDPMIALRYE